MVRCSKALSFALSSQEGRLKVAPGAALTFITLFSFGLCFGENPQHGRVLVNSYDNLSFTDDYLGVLPAHTDLWLLLCGIEGLTTHWNSLQRCLRFCRDDLELDLSLCTWSRVQNPYPKDSASALCNRVQKMDCLNHFGIWMSVDRIVEEPVVDRVARELRTLCHRICAEVATDDSVGYLWTNFSRNEVSLNLESA